MTKKTDKLYDNLFRAFEALWTDAYAHDLSIAEIRKILRQDVEYLLDEMERFEREVGRKMTTRQKRKYR